MLATETCDNEHCFILNIYQVIFFMKTYMCVICGFIYDEDKGIPEEGLMPGTRWEDIPLNWVCPECGASKDDFEMIEV